MKSKIHIPTIEFGYIEIDFHGTPEEIVDKHNEILSLIKFNPQGLQPKEFNIALDKYLNEGKVDSEVYMGMSREQQNILQNIKRSFNRINGLEKPKK